MREINTSSFGRCRPPKQTGAAAVEFALVASVFLMLFFGVLELARVMYICNTLQEVTRRAAALAANTNFADGIAMQRVRQAAVFRNSPGHLIFAEPVSDAHVRIDYLSVARDDGALETATVQSMPDSPLDNQEICMNDPNDARCIRMVRVRICQPGGGDCDPVPYQPLVSLIPLPFFLPTSTTVSIAETLGRPAGLPP